MSPENDPIRQATGTGIACILCGQTLSSTIEEPRNGDRHEALVCGSHSDEELSACGLGQLWAGGDTHAGHIHDGGPVRLAGAWELGTEGAHAVYLLFEDGDLLVITPEHDGVATLRVPRHRRLLEAPVGLPNHDGHPWKLALTDGTDIGSIRRRDDGRVELVLAGRGTVVFSVHVASWRELGDGKCFLAETWTPRC